MAARKLNLTVRQGETFQRIIRWEQLPFVYSPITDITQTAPVHINAFAHGLQTGWRAAIVSAEGMTEINATHSPLRDSDFHQVTADDGDNVSLNDVNSSDFSPYTGGGYLQSYTPVDMTSFIGRMEIKDRIGGTILMTLDTTNGRIIIDNISHTITLNIAAADLTSDLITWSRGVYDLEMESPVGTVTTLFTGNVLIQQEVTT